MRVPSYRRHSSGNARVTINGKDHLLGKFGSAASREKYKRLIAEYKASRRSKAFGLQGVLMRDVLLAYIRYAKEYYEDTAQSDRYKAALRPVKELYRTLPANEFGPKQFKAVRADWLEDTTRSRSYINAQMQVVARMVQWAVSEELIGPDQLVKIRAVKPLERGRTTAREPERVDCVPEELVDATVAVLTQVQADMVRFQLLTGCRPGELVSICPGMVDRSGDVWLIRLTSHKTAHKGKKRTIYIGPKAQAVLAPYLLRAADSACFSPKESEQQRRQANHAARVTPMSCGNTPGSKQLGRKPRVEPGDAYTTGAYRRAIYYACKRAKLKTWSPNQLRHNSATEIRKVHGIEGAQVILGHSNLSTTEIYAEADRKKAVEVARLIG